MGKILLDYVFPISVISPTPSASTAFLKQVCVVAKPKAGQEANVGQIFLCTNMTQVAARTDNTNSQQLFNAGMSKVYILLSDDLDLETALDENQGLFYTLLVSDDFADGDIATVGVTPAVKAQIKIQDITYEAKTGGTAGNNITVEYTTGGTAGAEVVSVVGSVIEVQIEDGVSTAQQIADAIEADVDADALVAVSIDLGDEGDVQAVTPDPISLAGGVAAITGQDGILVGTFNGVVGVSSVIESFLELQAAIENRCAFFTNVTNEAKNMFYAFGSLLANQLNWNSQQYITMPFNDDVDQLGEAENLFDNKISFVIHDDEFSNRLAMFACGGKAITAPYIIKDLEINLQSTSLQWITANQPKYTLKEAALLETRLQEDVVNEFISKNWIEDGNVEIKLEQDNFVASGYIDVAEPKALWRVVSQLSQTL